MIFWFEFESFEAFRTAFLGMQPINQILLFAALVALTVAAMILAYTIVKGAVKLVIGIFTWMFMGTKEVVIASVIDLQATPSSEDPAYHLRPSSRPSPRSRPRHPHRHHPHLPSPSPRRSRPPRASWHAPHPHRKPLPQAVPLRSAIPPKTSQVASAQTSHPTTLHCPMCGEPFTKEMFALLDQSSKTFCEFCGYQLEYVLS